jgi:hypothetical protein
MLTEQLLDIPSRRNVEWGLGPLVARMYIGTMVKQHLYGFALPISSC